jgi:ubiquinone/menaquinone biosynthesis C-methylase UbiE
MDVRTRDPFDFEARYNTAGALGALAYEQRMILEVLGSLRPGILLNVGTGFGKLINFPPPPEIVGMDSSESDLASAVQRYSGDASKHFVVGDASSLPFRDDAFDQVLSIKVIKFLEDPEAAVSEMADVLKPGGRLIVDVSNKYSPAAILRRLGSWLRVRPPTRAYFAFGDGVKMMASVGLTPFSHRAMFKVDPVFWRPLRNKGLVNFVEQLEGVLDRSTGPWFLSRYVLIACEKPYAAG